MACKLILILLYLQGRVCGTQQALNKYFLCGWLDLNSNLLYSPHEHYEAGAVSGSSFVGSEVLQ